VDPQSEVKADLRQIVSFFFLFPVTGGNSPSGGWLAGCDRSHASDSNDDPNVLLFVILFVKEVSSEMIIVVIGSSGGTA